LNGNKTKASKKLHTFFP